MCPTIYSTCARPRTSSLSLHPFHAARSTSPRTDIFITRNRSLTLSPSPIYIYIYIYIYILSKKKYKNEWEKGIRGIKRSRCINVDLRREKKEEEFIKRKTDFEETSASQKEKGKREREREGYRSLYIERIGACFSLSARPAVSRDNWDTVYYRLRAIVAAVAVCDWIGGDGSREIADPN